MPFDPERAFAAGADLTGTDTGEVIRRLYAEDELTDEEIAILDHEAVRWAADSYSSTAQFLTMIIGWVSDPDDQVVAHAAALAAWFAPTAATVSALITVPDHRAQPRASANLALAHSPSTDSDIEQRLRQLVASDNRPVAVTAAVALAYREGASVSEQTLSILLDAAEQESIGNIIGWDRSLRGFVTLALRRLGLS